MKFYNMDSKEFNALSKEFNHTAFGKRVALLSNLPIFALFFWAVIFAAVLSVYMFCKCAAFWYCMPDLGALIVVGFMLLCAAVVSGMLYYRELRKYASAKEKEQE